MHFMIDANLPRSAIGTRTARGDIRHYPPKDYGCIVVLRVPDHSTAAEIVAVLDRFLAEPRFVENLRRRLAIVDEQRVRFRPALE
jgi:hypothetical protein